MNGTNGTSTARHGGGGGAGGGVLLAADSLTLQSGAVINASGGIGGTSETGDQFGNALAVGDFDNDNYDDLAVGVPGETWSAGDLHQGAVHLFYGTANGLDGSRDALISQNSFAGETREAGDRFGESIGLLHLGQIVHERRQLREPAFGRC